MGAILHRGVAGEAGSGSAYNGVIEARPSPSNRFVYSTLTRSSANTLRLHSEVFDASTSALLREYSVTGNTALVLIDRMAANFSTRPTPLGVKNEAGLRQWAEGDCAALSQSEPAFGAALATCLERLTTTGQLVAVKQILDRSGGLAKDFSTEAQFAFAQGFYVVKDFRKAADLFRIVGVNQPTALNMLGYSETLSGNYEAGKKALEEYAKVPGQEANALDSLGEISFFAGQWKSSEDYFKQASAKWPTPQQTDLDLVKSGVARLMAGDEPGASAIVAPRFEIIQKRNPGEAAALENVWKSILAAPDPSARLKIISRTLIRRLD